MNINPITMLLSSASSGHKYYTLLHSSMCSLTVRISFACTKCIKYDLMQKYFISNFSRNEILGIDNRHVTFLMEEIIFLIDRIILSADFSPAFDNSPLHVIPYNEHFGWRGLGRWVERERERERESNQACTMYNNNEDTLTINHSFFKAFIFTFRYVFHQIIGSSAFSIVFKIKSYTNLIKNHIKGSNKTKKKKSRK